MKQSQRNFIDPRQAEFVGLIWQLVQLPFRLHAGDVIRSSRAGGSHLPFALYVRNDNRKPKLVKLIAACGTLDIDDPQPAITILLPPED